MRHLILIQEPWVLEAQRARSRRLRWLGVLGLLFFLVVLCACCSFRARPASLWSEELRGAAYETCLESVVEVPRFCACLTLTLEDLEPDPALVTPAKAQSAANACKRYLVPEPEKA